MSGSWDEPFEVESASLADRNLSVGSADSYDFIPSTDGVRDVKLFSIPDEIGGVLNPAQLLAVRSLNGPTLVVAGPGSGKTRVLTSRIAALVQSGLTDPWKILAVTFTNKAAAEMRERVEVLLGAEIARSVWVGTFHSVCVRILRANYQLAGLPSGFTIADDRDKRVYITRAIEGAGISSDVTKVRHAASLIGLAKNSAQSSADLSATLPFKDRWVAPVMDAYNKALSEAGSLDFDDILLFTAKLLEGNPEVLAQYQRKFSHILVDEYQDTNVVQYKIVCLLSAVSKNIAVVGDADQSIYAWRGSAPEVVDAFIADHPGTLVVRLEENYRSTKAIVEVAAALIEPNKATHRAALFTNNQDGKAVRLYVANDDLGEASWVTGEIMSMSPNAEHAVLMRTNSQTRVFEEALVRARRAYIVIGALRFYDRAEIKDAMSYLRLAVNPRDVVNFLRCANTPKRGLGDATLDSVVEYASNNECDLIQAARAMVKSNQPSARAAGALRSFLEIHDAVLKAAAEGPSAALDVVIHGAGGLRRALVEAKEEERVENIDELIVSAAEFSHITTPRVDGVSPDQMSGFDSLVEFLESTALIASVDTDEDGIVHGEPRNGAQVQLMTVHASKGREFENVWVVGIEEGLFPHTRSTDSIQGIEEERRLLFVAASRAKSRLTLSRSKRRMQYRQIVEPDPSRFLQDLPSSVEVIEARAQGASGGLRAKSTSTLGKWNPGSPLAKSVAPTTGPRVEAANLRSGMRVVHTVFGEGEVIRVSGDIATIVFSKVGEKLLDLKFAPLVLA